MGKLRTTPDTRFDVIAPMGARILSVLTACAEMSPVDLYITAGTNGVHSGTDDPHYRGEAYDVRTRNLPDGYALVLKRKLEDLLGAMFTVLYEKAGATPQTTANHLHIQVKKAA